MYAVITGASRGIGKALAYEYAKGGYDLVLTCEKNINLLEEIKNNIIEKYSRDVIIKKGLLKDSDLPSEIYVLINCAGKCHYGIIDKVDENIFDDLVNANLKYSFFTIKELSSKFLKRREGIIINISSMWGILGASCEVLYSMTKGGLNTLTKALAKEYDGTGIDVIGIALGAVETDMLKGLTKKEVELLEKTLDNGFFTPKEVAKNIFDIVKYKKYKSGDIIEMNNGLK